MSVTYGGDSITFDDGSTLSSGWGSLGKNLLINGSMQVDQRRAGNSTTPSGDTFTLDRWYYSNSQTSKFTLGQNLGGVTGPNEFRYCLGVQTASAYTPGAADRGYIVYNGVEGYDATFLQWGTADAKTVTLSFWARSSLTGTFGGVVRMAGVVSYPFRYTINNQNTWEFKTVTVPGYTVSASWNSTTTGSAVSIRFNLGSQNNNDFAKDPGAWIVDADTATGTTSIAGTANATWYITGVQLERGSVATSFQHVPFSVELMRCMRYYEKSYAQGTVAGTLTGTGQMQGIRGNGMFVSRVFYKVTKRATPGTITIYSPQTGTSAKVNNANSGSDENSSVNDSSDGGFQCQGTTASISDTYRYHWTADAEM